MVECDLAKVEVAGSTPVSRSITLSFLVAPLAPARGYAVRPVPYRLQIRRGTQVVRERSAKPLCVGSIPTRASIILVAARQTANNHSTCEVASAPETRRSGRKSASRRNSCSSRSGRFRDNPLAIFYPQQRLLHLGHAARRASRPRFGTHAPQVLVAARQTANDLLSTAKTSAPKAHRSNATATSLGPAKVRGFTT